MKNICFLFAAINLLFIELNAQTITIIVDSADEFINAIGSDRIMQLKGSTIYLSDLSTTNTGTNHKFFEEYDGYERVIFGVNNMKIVGLGKKPVKIITKPVYGDVLVFDNCNNITIENIEAGYGPEKVECVGGVFNIINSNYITINNSIMFGSGTEGLTAETVTGLTSNNSIIRGCMYSIMTLNNCYDFEFNDSEFSDNTEFDLVNISNCIDITFNSCRFSSNQTGVEDYSDYTVF